MLQILHYFTKSKLTRMNNKCYIQKCGTAFSFQLVQLGFCWSKDLRNIKSSLRTEASIFLPPWQHKYYIFTESLEFTFWYTGGFKYQLKMWKLQSIVIENQRHGGLVFVDTGICCGCTWYCLVADHIYIQKS